MRDTFLVFGKPTIGAAEMAEVIDSMETGWVGTGPKVQAFERMLESYIGVPHVRCVASCTAALILGMETAGIGPGDEVLLPSMTFVASANAVEHTGATPVLVDCEPDTGLIDLAAAEAAITPRTRAIMPVHLAGRPVDLDRVGELAGRHGLRVIEDAAHAIGAEWGGSRIGSHGNLTAFSFYVTKNMTTIEGGALATDDAAAAEEVERLALHGLSAGAWERYSDAGFKHYETVKPGYKYNMTDVQAALGVHQLPQLDGWIDRRAEAWSRYDELLAHLPLELPPAPEAGTRHGRHLYQVRLPDSAATHRDRLLDHLSAENIGTGVHYRAVHLHPYYRETYGLAPESLPVSASISERTLSLPLGPEITPEDQRDVAESLERGLQGLPTAAGASGEPPPSHG